MANQQRTRLTRNPADGMIGGVCAGIADHYDLDPTLVRLGWLAAAVVTGGIAVPAYAVAWLLMPRPDREGAAVRERAQDVREDLRDVTARAAEAARIAAQHAKLAADEIATVARATSAATAPSSASTPAQPDGSAPEDTTGTPPAESAADDAPRTPAP